MADVKRLRAIPRKLATTTRKRTSTICGKVGTVNYSNHSSRLRLRDGQPNPVSKTATFLSLEQGRGGLCLRVRTAATMARRKLAAFKLAAASVAIFACAATASAQLGYDPFAGNANHTEERWARYSSAALNGTNRPTSTFINGTDSTALNAANFNFGVTAPDPNDAFVTGSGNIYSPTTALTLTLSNSYTLAAGAYNTVVFSIRTLGNPLNTAGVLLTPAGSTTGISPLFTTAAASGTGMGASAQYAFQFDTSALGGVNAFTITLPGSASSVSFSASQLDATTATYGQQRAIPEPGTTALVALGGFGLLCYAVRLRRQPAA